MRTLLPALALGVAIAGCSAGGDADVAAPTTTPSTVPPATATATAGPPTAAGVPAGAFLSAADLGPGWSAAAPLVTPCTPTYARTAVRSTGLSEQRGVLSETVATGVDLTAAVAAWKQSLSGCGFAVRDETLGDAAVSALSSDGADAVFATGTEGVLVVLHVRGALARAKDDLDGWADLALGTSCVAAPDGCH